MENSTCVAIASGANMNFDRLRVVSELAELGMRSEAVLATSIPEEPGSFKFFVDRVGQSVNITEFKYRFAGTEKGDAHVLYSVSYTHSAELQGLKERMAEASMPTMDLSDSEVTKVHLRELVGGRAGLQDEVLYRFEFPDRPGALMHFLGKVSPRWNISLFHYRNAGTREASVLVGFQVHPHDVSEFHAALDEVGYPYTDVTSSFAFSAFCQ